MLSNITSNPQKEISPRQGLYQEGDLVYLYGDRKYTGTLISAIADFVGWAKRSATQRIIMAIAP